MAQVQAGQPAGKPTGGRLTVAAVTLIASAAAVNCAWILGGGLPEPSRASLGRLIDLLGGLKVVVSAALVAGMAGAFLLYTARWQAMRGAAGLASPERRRDLAARVLLSVAVSVMLVAIPLHGFLYLLAGRAGDCEFCAAIPLLLLPAVGVVALVTALIGLVTLRAETDLRLRVCFALGIATIVEPGITYGSMVDPAVGVVLNTAGIAGLLLALVWLVRARPRAFAQST